MAYPNFYATLTRAETLAQILGGWHVDGGPGQPGPLVTREMGQVLAADILRELAGQVRDKQAADGIRKLGRELLQRGAAGLGTIYANDGPPWIDYPWPLPWPPKKFDRPGVFDGLKPGALDDLSVSLAKRLADIANGKARPTPR